PDEEWHLEVAHAFGTHVFDGDDEIDRAEDRREAEQVQRDRPHRLAITAKERAQRRIARPARFSLSSEIAEQEKNARRRDQPEGEGVQPGKSHILRAEHERYKIIA